jgi:FlaA1/EpsC-like NDP-sugar epimerase
VGKPTRASAFALWVVGLSRYTKRTVLAVNDFLLFNVALWLAMSLRLGEFFIAPNWQMVLALACAPIIGVGTFFQLGLYRAVTRYPDNRIAGIMAVGIGLSTLYWGLLLLLAGAHSVPRSVVLLYPMLAALLILGSRQAAAGLLRGAGARASHSPDRPKRVLIYGAGAPGMQLLDALRRAGAYKIVGFIDPSANLRGQYIGGVKVFRPDRMARLLQNAEVDEVLLAMPKAHRADRQTALRQLEHMKVRVRTLPAIEDVAAGHFTVSDLRPVDTEDLLGRDSVPADPGLLARNIRGKCVMVTGAGGSIGSELARQVIRQKPRRVVLVEMSEAHLYEIDSQVSMLLSKLNLNGAARPPVVSVLGSVLDAGLMRKAIEENAVETIYHAAAFKHVPLVEHNPVAGLWNNTFGTATLADAAAAANVERFVLVSTDKAVRPTSIMGASKRLAEMALQARAADPGCPTIFTMVRFGNVLDSSGSVLRRFRHQIEAGGPVTVTHPEVIRYFMSIPEAAGLVIQAGAMASGGDVFVLDMGEPVRIVDLARSMIRLMGREVRDQDHPDGDIAIEFIGLRDGEKMYEELLLGQDVVGTEHPRIRRSREPFLPRHAFETVLADILASMADGGIEAIRDALGRVVENYRPEPRVRARKAPEAA